MIRSHANRFVALSLAPTVLLLAPLAAAQDRMAARRHFVAAERHYAASEWAEALVEYQAANDAAPLPEFVFDMAQCQRQLGHPSEALELYQRFLTEQPDAPNRSTVEDLIDEMRAQLAVRTSPAPAPPQPAPATPPPPVATPAAAPDAATAPPERTERRSALSRIRVTTWMALGGSVLALGASGLFALDASDAESDLSDASLDCKARLARCIDLQDRGDRSSLLRNTFFALGLAALAGTSVLAYLDLTGESSSDRVAAVVPAIYPNGLALAGVFTWP